MWQLQDCKYCRPLVIIKWFNCMWLNPAAGGQAAAVNHIQQVKSLQHQIPAWLNEYPIVWPRCKKEFGEPLQLLRVKKQGDDTRRTRPEVKRIEEFNLGIISGDGFIDKDPCQKQKKSHICLVSENRPCASERQSWPSKGNETDRKDDKEARLSTRRKTSFGVSFVDHQ